MGGGTITRNGGGAETKGFDVAMDARLTEQLSVRAAYAYVDAKLTADAPSFVRTIPDPATNPTGNPFANTLVDAFDGDRLPGSPKHQASVLVTYDQPVTDDLDLELNYAARYVSEILLAVGNRGGFQPFDDYSMHDASATLNSASGDWSVTLYVENIFDKFAESGGNNNPWYNQPGLTDETGRVVFIRTFTNPLPPRKIGVRFTKRFGG